MTKPRMSVTQVALSVTPNIPARVRASEIARITGLSTRTIQQMAAVGETRRRQAEKLGGIWTFDVGKVLVWIEKCEAANMRIKPTRENWLEAAAEARSTIRANSTKGTSLYAQMMARKRVRKPKA